VRYLRPVTIQTRTIVATGTLVHQGRRTATAEARLVDDAMGQVLATGTSTLLVVRP
jgi:acyl-coenzyme A thioesterase PaaI-like protein